ncbi:MAG: exopolysaccharide biosynthesis protein [Methanosphaera sp.]
MNSNSNTETLKTSKKLEEIRKTLPKENVTIRILLDNLLSEGIYLLVIILVAPFIIPVSIPGSSTPFGIMIMLLALSSLLNKKIYLPKSVENYEISPESFDKIFNVLYKALKFIERIAKPRGNLVNNTYILKFNSAVIFLLAFFLFLPIPIPLTDFCPALAILVLSVSNLEEDTYLMIVGYLITLAGIIYFLSVSYTGLELANTVLNHYNITILNNII